MKLLRKYYEDVCKKRQKDVLKMWVEGQPISYRWQDIVEEALINFTKS